LLRLLAWLPSPLVRLALVRYLLKCEKVRYAEGRSLDPGQDASKADTGQSFLLPGLRRKLGVVLVHSYLAVPEEVRALAGYLRRRGIWVFAPRLPGHGTSAEDLANRKSQEWVETVESGYVLMSTICQRVVLGGIAFGGNLALDLAGRLMDDTLAGVFAVSPPFGLRDYSRRIMPATDVWNRLLNKMKREEKNIDFLDFPDGAFQNNYSKNPVSGVKEVGEFLESIEQHYRAISKPALILQADRNPVVDPRGSQQVFAAIGSANKEFCLLSDDRHILVKGDGAAKVFAKIAAFVDGLQDG
jgi:esterase/lipase